MELMLHRALFFKRCATRGGATHETHEFRVDAPNESGETPPHSKTLARLAFRLHPTLRTPARFWSAPAERSGDGALDRLRTALETPRSCATRPQDPKRRGASLPAALQDAGALAIVARRSARLWSAPPLRHFRFPRQVTGPNARENWRRV